jgi:hypothetical protein
VKTFSRGGGVQFFILCLPASFLFRDEERAAAVVMEREANWAFFPSGAILSAVLAVINILPAQRTM